MRPFRSSSVLNGLTVAIDVSAGPKIVDDEALAGAHLGEGAVELRIINGALGVFDVIENTGSVGDHEAFVDTDEEARRDVEGFLGAELNALDLARHLAELGGRKNADLDAPAGFFLNEFFLPVGRKMVRVVNGDHADFHRVGLLRHRGGNGESRSGSEGG